MSTSLLYHAFGIRGYEYTRTDYQGGQTIFTIHQDPETCRCSACGSPQVQSRGQVERRFRALPIGSRATFVVLPIPRVECQACGVVRQVKIPFADPRRSYTKRLRALRPGVGSPHDHPRRGHAPGRQLGRDQGHPEARPVAALRQAQAQAPAAHRHRRDRHRQGAPLPDGGHGPGERRGGLRRRRQGGRCVEAVLEAAAAQQGQDRGGGHGHVGGVPRGGLDPPAQGEDRLRPLPCHQALQREALRPPPRAVPRGDRRACRRRCSRGRGGCC